MFSLFLFYRSFDTKNKFDPTLGPIQDDVIVSVTSGTGNKVNSWGAGE